MVIGRLGHLPLWCLTRGGMSRIAGVFVWSLAWTPSTKGGLRLSLLINAGKVHVGGSSAMGRELGRLIKVPRECATESSPIHEVAGRE
jgi:hypothetical protein